MRRTNGQPVLPISDQVKALKRDRAAESRAWKAWWKELREEETRAFEEMDLSLGARMAYQKLLRHVSEKGSLPNNIRRIAMICDAYKGREFNRIWKEIRDKFPTHPLDSTRRTHSVGVRLFEVAEGLRG